MKHLPRRRGHTFAIGEEVDAVPLLSERRTSRLFAQLERETWLKMTFEKFCYAVRTLWRNAFEIQANLQSGVSRRWKIIGRDRHGVRTELRLVHRSPEPGLVEALEQAPNVILGAGRLAAPDTLQQRRDALDRRGQLAVHFRSHRPRSE